MMKRFTLIYFADCPHYVKACNIICEVAGELDMVVDIQLKPIHKSDNTQIFGSPTVLFNGIDIESCYNETNTKSDADALSCRIYNCDEGIGCPSHDMVRCAIQKLSSLNKSEVS